MVSVRELSNMQNRWALITGATGSIGRVISETLAELGANLVLVDKPGSDFETLVSKIQNMHKVEISTYLCDLENQDSRTQLIHSVNDLSNGLDVLINNAAFAGTENLEGWNSIFEEQSVATWRRAIEVNLTAVFDLCQGLLPKLRLSDSPSIVNIASIYGIQGPDWRIYEDQNMANPAAYSVSKGGLIQLTRWLATTIAPEIRVNAIAPGGLKRSQPEEFIKRYSAKTPLGRMGTEDDLKGAIAYLSSDLSNYVTGQVLTVDGGWGVW